MTTGAVIVTPGLTEPSAFSASPVAGDKLLGWADWEQGVELVACPRCGNAMRILFQIDSCCGVPVMLADDGRGWVSQCPQHPDVVAFSWTCG
jgi:uncharacterized protein YbaR (Trm112 family)